MSIIEMRDVVKKYDNGTTALRGITVNIDAGEFAYIVGPSGAGKSTFIRALYREVKIDKGSLQVAGYNLVKIKKIRPAVTFACIASIRVTPPPRNLQQTLLAG